MLTWNPTLEVTTALLAAAITLISAAIRSRRSLRQRQLAAVLWNSSADGE